MVRPIQATAEAVGTPYVVFAGNVGTDDTLAYVIDLFAGNSLTAVRPGCRHGRCSGTAQRPRS